MSTARYSRREFLKLAGTTALVLSLDAPSSLGVAHADLSKKVIVLGIDGMDPKILKNLMDEGKMPHFKQLAEQGTFMSLGTSIPPQSPVAWSNFITGMDPGGHSIFDFIHREPEQYLPFLSTSKTEASDRTISLGDWVIPLSGGKVELLRKGKAFWQILEEHGVPTAVIKMPANFPPAKCKGKSISGMGTPDMLGTYGMFSFFTDHPEKFKDEDISGGKIYPVEVIDNVVKAQIVGPKNTFKKEQPKIAVDFTVNIDPENPVAKITVEGQQILLNVGEWSDWVHLKFSAVPHLESVSGMCLFYLKEVRPNFNLYVSPINIDPLDPALPICTPKNYSADLADKVDCFYTLGLPQDTKAFSVDALGVDGYLGQVEIVLDETIAMYDYFLRNFNSGLLFFYFCTIDQSSHTLWWFIDPKHPLYDPELGKKYEHVLYDLYQKMDETLGKALQRADENTTIIVMSDHGFAPFYRCFNLNAWLRDNGYVTLTDDKEGEFYSNVDWSKTRAYGLGLNGFYINQRGREGMGIVDKAEKDKLLDEIGQKLLQVRDPKTGEQVILRFYKTKDVYTNPDERLAPDAIIGYNRGYRASWQTAIGTFPKESITDNMDRWSADHCIASEVVPGIFLSNKKAKLADPSLRDLTPTVLEEFGIKPPANMTGRAVF